MAKKCTDRNYTIPINWKGNKWCNKYQVVERAGKDFAVTAWCTNISGTTCPPGGNSQTVVARISPMTSTGRRSKRWRRCLVTAKLNGQNLPGQF